MTAAQRDDVGDILRDWRRRRRLSQMDLSGEAEVSTRHLSFVESGRAKGSRDLLLRLADGLRMPLREQNRLLLAGGFAPAYPERRLDSAEWTQARTAIEAILAGQDPFPALVADRGWNLMAANRSLEPFLRDVSPALLDPPVNVLRLSLHPEGLAPRILNLEEWRRHLLHRLRLQAEAYADPALFDLHRELSALPGGAPGPSPHTPEPVAVPLRLADPQADGVLSFLSTATRFETATDVSLSELTLECFFPADEQTRARLLGRP